MQYTRIVAVGIVVLSLGIASCGGGNVNATPPVSPGGPTPTPSPGTSALPTATPSVAPTTGPTTPPTITPTAPPTVTPTAPPTIAPTTAPALCAAPVLTLPSTAYTITVMGNLPAGGGALSSGTGTWSKATYVTATPAPSPSPTTLPTAAPTPTPPPNRPIYFFRGTYTVTSSSAPTTGCFTLIATVDGTPLRISTQSSIGFGAPNFPATLFTATSASAGLLNSITLTALASGSGNGTFHLDDGDSGTIAITSVTTQNLPLARGHIPR